MGEQERQGPILLEFLLGRNGQRREVSSDRVTAAGIG